MPMQTLKYYSSRSSQLGQRNFDCTNSSENVIKLVDFLTQEPLTATMRLLWMYINNNHVVERYFVPLEEEVMLADVEIWQEAIYDHALPGQIGWMLLTTLVEQRQYLSTMPGLVEHQDACSNRKLDFIQLFQARVTELLFLDDSRSEIEQLCRLSADVFTFTEASDIDRLWSRHHELLKLQRLLDPNHIRSVLDFYNLMQPAPEPNCATAMLLSMFSNIFGANTHARVIDLRPQTEELGQIPYRALN